MTVGLPRFREVGNPVDAAELLEQLGKPGRLPLVGVARSRAGRRLHIDPAELARRLEDRAQVWILPSAGLTALPEALNVFGGAARIWFSGADPVDRAVDGRDHPYFVANTEAEGRAAVDSIVAAVVDRGARRGCRLEVDHRGRVRDVPANVQELLAEILDHGRRSAVVAVSPGTMAHADAEQLARTFDGDARVFVLADARDAEEITAQLPDGAGFRNGGVRIWWPGVGQRSPAHVHGEFDDGQRTLERVAGFVRAGSRPLRLVRPDGTTEDLAPHRLPALLHDPQRKRIVIGVSGDRNRLGLDAGALAAAVGPAADVVVVPTRPAAARLAAALPERLDLPPGFLRVWLPGLDWLSRAGEHPSFQVNAATSGKLIAHAAEMVRRRTETPWRSERSEVRHWARDELCRRVQRQLDRLGVRRNTEALELARRRAIGLASGLPDVAVAAWADAVAIVLDSARRTDAAATPALLVYILSDVAAGWFALGQAVGGPDRAPCLEAALAAYEEALAAALALPPEAVKAAQLDLAQLRTRTATLCRYVAQRRHEQGRTDLWDTVERGLELYDHVIARLDDPVRRAWALHDKAQLLQDPPIRAGAPRLSTNEAALEVLHDAVRALTGGSASLDDLVDCPLVGPEAVLGTGAPDRYKLAVSLLTALADTYCETGELDLARRAFATLDRYRSGDRDQHPRSIMATLRFGRLELDHGDMWAGVARLEQALARHDVERLTGQTHGNAIMAIQALAYTLREYTARESEYYRAWAERLERPVRLPGEASERRDRRRRVRTAPDGAVVADVALERLGDIVDRLGDALEQEFVYHVHAGLERLSQTLWRLRPETVPADAEVLTRARATLVAVDAWHPRRRTPPVSSVPAAWSTLPGDLRAGHRDAAITCLLMASEFANHYSPGAVPRMLRQLVRQVADVHGFHPVIHGLSVAAAERAASGGRWRHAVRAYTTAARYMLDTRPEETVALAQAASDQLQRGLGMLDLGDDCARTIAHHERDALRVVELMLRAGAEPKRLFAAMDRAKGQVLIATRAATEPGGARSDTMHELRRLQLEELDLHLVVGTAASTGQRYRQEAVQRQIAAARRRLLRVAPETVHAFSTGEGPEAIAALEAAPELTVIVQYVVVEGELYACAARGGGGHDVTYWSSLEPLATKDEVREAATAMWDDILSVSRTIGRHESFEDGHDVLLGGADRVTGESLAAFCAPASTLVVVPGANSGDGAATAGVPFHALRHDGAFLVERHHVVYAPSAAFYAQSMTAEVTAAGRGLAVGTDVAIGAVAECDAVAAILERTHQLDCRVEDQESAISGALLERERGEGVEYDVVHIAAHGRSRPFPDHMDSSLRFGDFGVTARDWLLEGVRAQLAFVNCCSVGRQVGRAGDLYGIPFAALGSGSSSTVFASSPVAPTLAHAFACRFYEVLEAGLPRAHAMSLAMRGAIHDGAPPEAWAPYFFSGDPRPLEPGRPDEAHASAGRLAAQR